MEFKEIENLQEQAILEGDLDKYRQSVIGIIEWVRNEYPEWDENQIKSEAFSISFAVRSSSAGSILGKLVNLDAEERKE